MELLTLDGALQLSVNGEVDHESYALTANWSQTDLYTSVNSEYGLAQKVASLHFSCCLGILVLLRQQSTNWDPDESACWRTSSISLHHSQDYQSRGRMLH